MRVDMDYSAAATPVGGANSAVGGGDFAAALAQASAEGGTQAREAQKRQPTPEERATEVRQANAALGKELQEYLDKPLAVHIREAVMKEMGLSEDDLAKMSPEKRQAAEAEINRRVRERLLGQKSDGEQSPMDALQRPVDPGAASASPSPLLGGSAALDALIARMAGGGASF